MCLQASWNVNWSLSLLYKNVTRTYKEIKIAYSMCHEVRREPTANMLHKPLSEECTNKIQYVPFQPVTCLNSKLGMITNEVFQIHICTLCCACVTTSCLQSDLFGCRGASWSEAGLRTGPAVRALTSVKAHLTCTRTRRCAVWCFRTGSVSGSCTCLALPSCSLRG